jgi:UDP:flavonoid glycosyltransferase YjiC (YdhE family)
MKRIVLATSGSLGDLHPYIAIGVELKRRGFEVTIATAETYRRKVCGEGLGFCPIRPDIAPSLYTPEIFRRANDLRTGTKYLIKELVLPYVDNMYEDLLQACAGADLLVIHPILFVAPVVAEKLKMKWLSVALSPSTFVSAYDPPLLPPFPWLHALRHFGPVPNRLVLDLFRRITRSWMNPIDQLRERVGLPPATKHPIHAGMFSPFGTLGCFSQVLGLPQPDWPSNTRVTGFTFYDKQEREEGLEPALEDFLVSGDAPVVFTLGSSAVMDAGNFYQASFDAVERIGCRAVFLTGTQERNRPQGNIAQSVFISDYAPYSKVFPRAAAVVHQGGIGTTAQSLRAGVPMLVVPFLHDQPDNAFRVKRMGVARIVRRACYSADAAAQNLNWLLTEGSYRERAQAAAAQLRAEDGVANACRAIEQLWADSENASDCCIVYEPALQLTNSDTT